MRRSGTLLRLAIEVGRRKLGGCSLEALIRLGAALSAGVEHELRLSNDCAQPTVRTGHRGLPNHRCFATMERNALAAHLGADPGSGNELGARVGGRGGARAGG